MRRLRGYGPKLLIYVVMQQIQANVALTTVSVSKGLSTKAGQQKLMRKVYK